jgi:hypothetical protein
MAAGLNLTAATVATHQQAKRESELAWLLQADKSESQRHAEHTNSDEYKAYQAKLLAWHQEQERKKAEEAERQQQSAAWAAFREQEKMSYASAIWGVTKPEPIYSSIGYYDMVTSQFVEPKIFCIPKPAVNISQVNIALGLTLHLGGSYGTRHLSNKTFVWYNSIVFASDNQGHFQFFKVRRDQIHVKGNVWQPGPAEFAKPSYVLSAGVSGNYGGMYGPLAEARGTTAVAGTGVNSYLSVGPLEYELYQYFDKDQEMLVPSQLVGHSLGYSLGLPFGYGSIATETTPLTGQIKIPDFLIPLCQSYGHCGSYPSLLPLGAKEIVSYLDYFTGDICE